MTTQEKRDALALIPREARVTWFDASGFPKCSDCTKHNYATCASLAHWSLDVVDAAHTALCTANAPAPVPPGTPTWPTNTPTVPAPAKRAASIDTMVRAIAEDVAEQVARDTSALKAELEKLIDAKLSTIPARVIEVKHNGKTVRLEGERYHVCFERIVKKLAAKNPDTGRCLSVMLVGPAGTGKSKLPEQAAKALGFRFAGISCTEGMSETALTGRYAPGSEGKWGFVTSQFVDFYENGGIFLIDEIDAANPNVLLVINNAIANGHLPLPNRPEKPVAKRHGDFRLVVTANTYGIGADRMYVGRNQLDAATLDRFKVGTVEVGYDKKLEEALGVSDDILLWGWAVREVISSKKLRKVLSTRVMLDAMLAASCGDDTWKESYFSDWTPDELAALPASLRG